MLARILRKYHTFYAGQILSNVRKGDFPEGVAEYFEDDDPAVNTVRQPGPDPSLHTVNDDEVEPLKGSDFAKEQAAKVKAVEAEQAARVELDAEAADEAKKTEKAEKAKARKKR